MARGAQAHLTIWTDRRATTSKRESRAESVSALALGQPQGPLGRDASLAQVPEKYVAGSKAGKTKWLKSPDEMLHQ